MTIPKITRLSYYDIKYGNGMPSSLFVKVEEHDAVVKVLVDEILKAKDELIAAYNEIIALKSNIPYQIVQKEPVAQFDGCWAVKRNNEDAKAIRTKPSAQFLMDKLGICYPQALGLLDTGRLTTNNGTELKLWKVEAL